MAFACLCIPNIEMVETRIEINILNKNSFTAFDICIQHVLTLVCFTGV